MHGWTEFITMQNLHNACYREEELEMFPACAKFGMAGIPWSPVGMGYLTRPHKDVSTTARGGTLNGGFQGFFGQEVTDADRKTNEKIAEIAERRGTSMAVVSIAWSLSKPFIHSPIIGMSKKERVDEACRAVEFELSKEEVTSIDELYVPRKVMGFK